jgi:hypothetical protein
VFGLCPYGFVDEGGGYEPASAAATVGGMRPVELGRRRRVSSPVAHVRLGSVSSAHTLNPRVVAHDFIRCPRPDSLIVRREEPTSCWARPSLRSLSAIPIMRQRHFPVGGIVVGDASFQFVGAFLLLHENVTMQSVQIFLVFTDANAETDRMFGT